MARSGRRPPPARSPAQSFEDAAFALLLITAAMILDTIFAVLVVT